MSTTVKGLDELGRLGGVDLGSTGWLPVTQERVDTFVDAVGDSVEHGYLPLSLVIPLWTNLLRIEGVGMAVNYGLNRTRFPAPVPVGAKIRLHARVESAVAVDGPGVELTTTMIVECSTAPKPAVIAEAVYRYYA